MKDDLISRQSAIEYFMTNTNWHDEDGYEIHDAEDKRALLKSYFDGIPPAQPEHTCVGCKHYGMWENEVEYGYNSPCTKCRRRMNDNYEQ